MLTRQGAAQLIASEFARLSNIDINYPDRSNVHPVVYRPAELIMAEKTIATLLSKTLEQTPKYSGKPDQNADEWLNDLIATCRMADITEAHALKIIPTFLEGHAKQWYSDNKETFESWTVFKTEFIRTYSSPTTKQLASNRLRTRLQHYDELVIEYYTDIMKLCKLVDPSMTDASKLDHLYHGLKHSLMKEVLRQNPQTPSDFLEHARREETLDRLVTTSVHHTNDTIDTNTPHTAPLHPAQTAKSIWYHTSPNTSYAWHPPQATQYQASYPSNYQQSSPHNNPYISNTSFNDSYPHRRSSNDGSDSHHSQPSLSYSSTTPVYSSTKFTTYYRQNSSYYSPTRKPQPIPYYFKQRQVQSIGKQRIVNKNTITTNPSLIFINTLINGKPIRAMIDTGASHSFITQRALRTLSYFRLPSCERAAQLGDGQTTLKIVGEVQLLLQFDQVFTPVNALVTQTMNTDFILGGDWCTKNKVKIDYAKSQVSLCTKLGRIFIPYDKHIDYLSLEVKSINVIHIPPRESCAVQAKVELSSANTVYFSPADTALLERSVIMSPALLHVNNYTTYLEIYNPHDTTCTLPMNTRLGQITHTPHKLQSCVVFDPSRCSSSWSSQHHVINTIELKQTSSKTCQIIDKLLDHITNCQDKHQLRHILERHIKIFDISNVTQANTSVQHIINTGASLPLSSRPYPRTIQQRRELQAEIQKMLHVNQIRPSNSPWSSPVIIHKKKDGGIRFLVDYRKLNSVTKKDSFPQPTTEELLHRLGGHCFYSKLDLKSGYFQIPIHEADKEKTAFITQDGLWEFNVLPQGIMNGPPTFQRTMHNLLGYGRWDYVMAYLDDILIFSRTFDEHVKHLTEILSILAEANFQVNPDKCFIAVQEIDFLGHTINEHSIKPNGEKIKAIVDLPSPKTLKEANAFLGKINWYRKFIPNFARIAAPLHKVTNKTKHRRHEFRRGSEQQQSFEEFKHILTTSPLFLEYPDLSTPFTLTTDASDIGIGGILRQDTPAGTKINYFKSRVLNDTERKYDTFEQEALAIYWCITELRSYIGDSNFIVETDHRPLENFHLKQINNKRVMNWIFKLQDILPQIIAVKYCKGAHNTAADYISRHLPSSTSVDTTPPGPTDTPHSHMCDNAELNAVTTRAQAKLLAQPRSSPPIAPESTRSSPPTSTQSYDFSLSRIRTEQNTDLNIQNIIQQIRSERRYSSFLIQDDILYKLVRRDNAVLKLIYTPATLIPDLLTAYHDHPLSGHFGIARTWSQLRNTYYYVERKVRGHLQKF
ncbi:unnamed protein product [Rotaria sp. Silwood2]|nr:unnamed protein product [Rotaria sp. Silwood2]